MATYRYGLYGQSTVKTHLDGEIQPTTVEVNCSNSFVRESAWTSNVVSSVALTGYISGIDSNGSTISDIDYTISLTNCSLYGLSSSGTIINWTDITAAAINAMGDNAAVATYCIGTEDSLPLGTQEQPVAYHEWYGTLTLTYTDNTARQIYLGSSKIDNIYLGATALDSVYFGNTKIWGQVDPENIITFDTTSNGDVTVTSSTFIQTKTVTLYTTYTMSACTVTDSVSGVYRSYSSTIASDGFSCTFTFSVRAPLNGRTSNITYTVTTAKGIQTVTKIASASWGVN